MPVFSPDIMSNEDLEAVAEWVASLEGGHAHMAATGAGDQLTMHHWMALSALDVGETIEAGHHISHITELTEGQHKARMEEALDLIGTGETHEVAHIVEQMLAGTEAVGFDEVTMHLRMALSSARVEEFEGSAHHMEHYVAVAVPVAAEQGQEIVDSLSRGDTSEAEHEVPSSLTVMHLMTDTMPTPMQMLKRMITMLMPKRMMAINRISVLIEAQFITEVSRSEETLNSR